MKKKPWMKWFPADWRADPRLRMCSLAARGLWADLISYMHEGEPYGHLTVNGISPDIGAISRLVGCPLAEVKKAMIELEEKKVASSTPDGVLFSRRMVRDYEKSEEGREWAEKRWGNREDDRPPNGAPKHSPNTQKPEARKNGTVDACVADPPSPISSFGVPQSTSSAYHVDAFPTSDAILGAFGIEPKHPPPGWCGLPLFVDKCLKSGYLPDVMIAEATAIMGRREKPPDTFSYLEKPFARAQAQHTAPLPKVEITPQTVSARNGSNEKSGFAAIDRVFERFNAEDQRPGTTEKIDEDAVLSLPARPIPGA